MNFFHAVNIAIKQQHCNMVWPQLNSDHFTHIYPESFAFDTRYEHFYNLKLLYSGYFNLDY